MTLDISFTVWDGIEKLFFFFNVSTLDEIIIDSFASNVVIRINLLHCISLLMIYNVHLTNDIQSGHI